MQRYEIVYHLDADDFSGEVNAREIGSIIYSFADVVQEAMKELGHDEQVTVNVKPFTEGSFLMEFVVNYGGALVSLFSGQEANALVNVMAILGFVKNTAQSLPSIIRKTKGRVNDFIENQDGTYTYDPQGEAITVDSDTHRIIQSRSVAKSYFNISVGPVVNIDNSVNITVQDKASFVAGNHNQGAHFTAVDIPNYEEYERTVDTEPEDEEADGVFTIDKAVLNPLSGSYGGSEKGYKFRLSNNKMISGVEILDETLLEQLSDGSIRFASHDTLIAKVSYEKHIEDEKEKISKWKLVELYDYIPYKAPQQSCIEDFLDKEDE